MWRLTPRTTHRTSRPIQQHSQAKQELLDAFSSAKGLIRSEIGKRVKVRYTPELVFKMDISLEYGQRIDEVISELGIEKYENDEDEE